jgi:DNA-binding MarR family transcriptional regulator
MAQLVMKQGGNLGSGSAAFLLAQVGAYASDQFAKRLETLGFTPAHAGIFRIIATRPGLSQQELATKIGMYPSRLVALIDDLEKRSMIERQPSKSDRRLYALHLTKSGSEQLSAIGAAAKEHGRDLLDGLSEEEQLTLATLLKRVPSCVLRANPSEPSLWSAPLTNWPPRCALIRSSCACATSRIEIPHPGSRSRQGSY